MPCSAENATASPGSARRGTRKRCVTAGATAAPPSPAPGRSARAASRRRERGPQLVGALGEHPGQDRQATGAELRGQLRVQVEQGGNRDVGQDQVERLGRAGRRACPWRTADDVADGVAVDVLLAHAGRDRLDLDRLDVAQRPGGRRRSTECPSRRRRRGRACQARRELLERLQTQARRRVQAGAEGHARVEQQDDVVGARLVLGLPPARHDDACACRRDGRRNTPSRHWPSPPRAACAPAAGRPGGAGRAPRLPSRSARDVWSVAGSRSGRYVLISTGASAGRLTTSPSSDDSTTCSIATP